MKELEELRKILDDDEVVLESFKPNKKRFVTLTVIVTLIGFLLFGGAFFVIGILGILNIIQFTNESGGQDLLAPIMLLVFGSFPTLFFLINIIGVFFRYKRTLYVVTNKRIVIRSGFIGVDYKSLDLKFISTVDVRVDFLDKLVHPNTGSINFGSAATPVMNNGNNKAPAVYSFAHVNDPYEVYKKVKSHINN